MKTHKSFWRFITGMVLLGLSAVSVAGGTTTPAAATGPVQFMDLQWLKSVFLRGGPSSVDEGFVIDCRTKAQKSASEQLF